MLLVVTPIAGPLLFVLFTRSRINIYAQPTSQVAALYLQELTSPATEQIPF